MNRKKQNYFPLSALLTLVRLALMDVPICPCMAAGHFFSVASTEKTEIMRRQYNNNNNNNNNIALHQEPKCLQEGERERETLTFNPTFINYSSLLHILPVNKTQEIIINNTITYRPTHTHAPTHVYKLRTRERARERERILKVYLSYCIRKPTIGAVSYLFL